MLNIVFAAAICWTVSGNTQSEADVRTDGKLLYAYAPAGVTVNGVRFVSVPNGGSFPADITFANRVNSISGAYWHDSLSRWKGGEEYKTLLSNGFYSSRASGCRQCVMLHGLEAGRLYLVQVWFNDMREPRRGSCQYLDGKVLAMSDGGNYFGANAVGTFVSSGSEHRFVITSNIEDQINAIQVRDLDARAKEVCEAEIASCLRRHPLSKYNSTWTNDNLGVSHTSVMPTAALLGNGSLGVVNGGVDNGKLFVLTRGDLWSAGALECGRGSNPRRDCRPISFADFVIEAGEGKAKYTDTLDIGTATMETIGMFSGNKAVLRSFVAADDDVFVVCGVAARDACWKLRIRLHDDIDCFPVESFVLEDGIGVRRRTIDETKGGLRGWVTNATAVVRTAGAEIFRTWATSSTEAVAEARVFAGRKFAIAVFPSADRKCDAAELLRLRGRHLDWWKEWWGRTRVRLNDYELEQYYYGSLYLLGSGVRKGKFPPGIYGIWVTTDTPYYKNDFHLNYNYIATFYGCYAANRPEIAYNVPDPFLAYLPSAEMNAMKNLGALDRCRYKKEIGTYVKNRRDLVDGISDAALFPVSLGPWGTAPEGDDKFWCQTLNGPYSAVAACTYWEYTLDRDYLRRVWPLLDKVANFYLSWCEKEPLLGGGYRYVLWDSWCEDFGLRKNCGATIGLVRHLFETLVDVAPILKEIGVDVSAGKLARWRDFLANLSALPTGITKTHSGKELRVFSNYETGTSHAAFVPVGGFELESVFPGEVFSFDAPPAYREAAVNTVAAKVSFPDDLTWESINQTTKLYPMAIRAGYPAPTIVDAFKKNEIKRRGNRNYSLNDGHHGVEKSGAIEFINSMLIQCDHGFVKVFPNWIGKDASFENLRAKGAFTVSSEMRGGKVLKVVVKSEKGGIFRLVDPFDGCFMPDSGIKLGRTRHSDETTIEFEMRPGEVREFRKAGKRIGCTDSPRPQVQ